MNIFSIGNGFVSDHLPYSKINERINSYLDIENIISKYKPKVLINCIGKTGRPNIDWCESHKEETVFANTTVPILLAEACAKNSIHLIQIGSGCIFFSDSPSTVDYKWKETDFANPKSFYSQTKYACDIVLGNMKNVTTLRIRMPISTKNNQRNLINKLRGYIQIIDIPNSMTFMDDLVRCVDWAINEKQYGIFHVTNPEPITAAQIMSEYQKYDTNHKFEIISEFALDKLTIAKRSNCILDTSKLQNAGFKMTPSSEALSKCISEYVKNI